MIAGIRSCAAGLPEPAGAFPTALAPVVGQPVTLVGTGTADVHARIDLLIARASAPFESLMLGGTSPNATWS